MIFKVLTKKQTKQARGEFVKIINDVRKLLKGKYKFTTRDNGSNKYNFNIADSNEEYDLDYLMILTKNCKSKYYTGKPTKIREEIFNTFQDVVKKEEYYQYNTEQSKSVITLIKIQNNIRTWSYDICITKEFSNIEDDDMERIARNSQGNEIDGGNTYTWNELGKINEGEKWFRELEPEKREKMREKIIKKKEKSKKLGNKNHGDYKTTSQIFLEVYNENK